MAVILGIDAAWTERGSSGVALLTTNVNGRAKIIAGAASYGAFLSLQQDDPWSWERKPTREVDLLDVEKTLIKARELAGADVDLVAIDMPLSLVTVDKRRLADDMVSSEFGSRRAGVHSPTPQRPGSISTNMKREFSSAGYPLATAESKSLRGRCIIEVFPLAALVTFMRLKERPRYKVGKIGRFWPDVTDKEQRRKNLLGEWRVIVDALQMTVDFNFRWPEADTDAALKPFEDVLDAIVCAWIGLCAFRDEAYPLGDDHAAIWVPCEFCVGLPMRQGSS
jgi:predicted RNase H-like nuclease